MPKRRYSLVIPRGAKCIVGGCDFPVERVLNLRIRRRDTGATYGPNIEGAYLCYRHGGDGADLRIEYTPRSDGVVRTEVVCGGRTVATMTRPITGGHPGQGDLFE